MKDFLRRVLGVRPTRHYASFEPVPIGGPGQDDELVAWLAEEGTWRNVIATLEGGPYTCPCCGHRTLPERGAYDLCSECDWEDDGQDDHDSDVVRRGPNGPISLDAARAAYVAGGGVSRPHVVPEGGAA